MPNWCNNTLEVSGEDMSLFNEDVKSSDSELSFNNLIPIPENLDMEKDELKKILSEEQFKKILFDNNGKIDWYSFCCNNWGSKWDASDVDKEEMDDLIVYRFQTAWSPPEEWLTTISKRYNCHFELTSYEDGNDFWFHMEIEDGEIIYKDTMTIQERILSEIGDTVLFHDVKNQFLLKLSEIEYDKDVSVCDIEELTEIIDELDCEFGSYNLYFLFDNYREEYYSNKK